MPLQFGVKTQTKQKNPSNHRCTLHRWPYSSYYFFFCSLWAATLYKRSKLLSCLVTAQQGFHWCLPAVCSGEKVKARPFCCLYNSPGQISSCLPGAPSIIPSVWVCKPTCYWLSSHRAVPYWLASSVWLTTAQLGGCRRSWGSFLTKNGKRAAVGEGFGPSRLTGRQTDVV